jgi:hypothetical protein
MTKRKDTTEDGMLLGKRRKLHLGKTGAGDLTEMRLRDVIVLNDHLIETWLAEAKSLATAGKSPDTVRKLNKKITDACLDNDTLVRMLSKRRDERAKEIAEEKKRKGRKHGNLVTELVGEEDAGQEAADGATRWSPRCARTEETDHQRPGRSRRNGQC